MSRLAEGQPRQGEPLPGRDRGAHTHFSSCLKMNRAPEIVDRVSAPSVDKAHLQVEEGTFAHVKTPDGTPQFDDGALRPGGPPNIYSKEHLGLLVHYFGSGMLYSISSRSYTRP
jgi:hypothetical protein